MLPGGRCIENKVVLKGVEEMPSACRKLGVERIKQEKNVSFEDHRRKNLKAFLKMLKL